MTKKVWFEDEQVIDQVFGEEVDDDDNSYFSVDTSVEGWKDAERDILDVIFKHAKIVQGVAKKYSKFGANSKKSLDDLAFYAFNTQEQIESMMKEFKMEGKTMNKKNPLGLKEDEGWKDATRELLKSVATASAAVEVVKTKHEKYDVHSSSPEEFISEYLGDAITGGVKPHKAH